jgi:hypothetical protein
MNRNRLIFYAVFAIFHISILAISIFFNAKEQDELLNYFMKNLNALFNWISLSKYAGILGLILITTDIVWSFMIHKKTEFEKTSLTNELTTLKAKLFDLQEAAKKTSETTPTKDKQP